MTAQALATTASSKPLLYSPRASCMMRLFLMRAELLLSLCLALALLAGAYRPSSRHVRRSLPSVLQAKRSSGQREGKGFSAPQQKTLSPSSEDLRAEKMPPMAELVDDSSSSSGAIGSETVVEATTAEGSLISSKVVKQGSEQEVDAVFKKYGITGDKKESPKKKGSVQKTVPQKVKFEGKEVATEAPFGEAVMAGIAPELQMKIDNFLLVSTFAALTFVIVSGIGITLGAFKIVFKDVQISAEVDGLITNFLSPAFTPALGVFLFFSVTFGLFKYAQISSSQTVYRE